jgi:myo-inositol-1(or 4)-monophosphatase
MTDTSILLTTARDAALAGASVVMASRRSGVRIPYTAKARNDFVTAVDREAEAAIVETIRARFPGHEIMAEEAERTRPGEGIRWIIDPLDGTTNFIHGFPVFSVSVAAAELRTSDLDPDHLVAGVVHDPLRDETFTAARGEGAALNGEPIRISGAEELVTCLLATGFPFRAQHRLETYLKIFTDLHTRTQGIRRAGSAALDLCYVASSRADGFFEFALSPWDMAAGTLLVREAGGVVRGFTGGNDFLETGDIVAGGPGIVDLILEVIAKHFP